MKRILAVCVLLALLFTLTGCAQKAPDAYDTALDETQEQSNVTQTEQSAQVTEETDETAELPTVQSTSNTLIAYFSCTGNTKTIAGYIQEALGADSYEITPKEPYTSEDLSYNDPSCRANRENNDENARPEIEGSVSNMDDYDIVFVGYPIWYGKAPKIIYTFLESYNFSGKTIVPFCTSASSGIGSSADNLHKLCSSDTKWVKGKRFSGSSTMNEVKEWIDSLDLPTDDQNIETSNVFPQHEAYGKGVGACPGRVVWAYDPDSVDWNGEGYWWNTNNFDEDIIKDMVNKSIASLGGKTTASEGWDALFTAHNASKGDKITLKSDNDVLKTDTYKASDLPYESNTVNSKFEGISGLEGSPLTKKSSSGGYKPGQKIAIKANINGSAVYDDDTSCETKMSYTNPVLLKALLSSLVEEAGVAASDITVYDVSRLFPDYMVDMCTQGELRGVKFVDRNTGVADENAPINWSYSFSGNVNYLPTCVTEADYIINLANLKGHSYGITLCAKNHFGSFINGNAMRPPEGANLHQWLTKNEMGIYSPLVDLMANYHLGGKTVLYMLDALICAPSEGASITGSNSKWQQSPFNGDYTSSIFMSQDPVAIDSVGADFLINEPTVTENNSVLRNNPNVENYLHEAGLVSHAPSGTEYTNSFGVKVQNLGVHEHWNNSTDKKYGRNLGKSEGIELISIN